MGSTAEGLSPWSPIFPTIVTTPLTLYSRSQAPRRMTEQGIANIRKAHVELAKRQANRDPVPVTRVRMRMRKAEITRMTKDGMSPADIAKNLEARGVKLKRGAATVERLRTIWGLVPDSQRNPHNVRQFCRNQALRMQKEQFENIARELGIEDVDAWVKSKMDEGVASNARHEHAYKLMGDLRPKPPDSSLARRNAQHVQFSKEQNRTQPEDAHFEGPGDPQESMIARQGDAAAGGSLEDPTELSVDEDELDSVDGEDDHSPDKQQTPRRTPAEDEHLLPTTVEMEQSPTFHNPVIDGQQWQKGNPGSGRPTFDGNGHPAIGQQPLRPAQGSNAAPCVATNLPPLTQDCMVPHAHSPVAPGVIAPTPAGPRPLAPRPIAPRLPTADTAVPGEAELMAKYGLFPYPTLNRPPQKYLTPVGLITTVGYEYLPNGQQAEPPPQQFPPQVTVMSSNYSPDEKLANGQSFPSDAILVPPLPPPAPPKVSKIPAPPLVIPPDEIEKHRDGLKAIEQYHQDTQLCLDLLAARSNNRPLADSLTGMPPSLKDITNAKERLREAARAMLEAL